MSSLTFAVFPAHTHSHRTKDKETCMIEFVDVVIDVKIDELSLLQAILPVMTSDHDAKFLFA